MLKPHPPEPADVLRAMRFTAPRSTPRGAIPDHVEIRRGAFLRVDYLLSLPEHWQREWAARLARIIAVEQTHPRCVPVGPSAALIHGLNAYDMTGDVHMGSLSNSTRSAKPLRAVVLGDEVLLGAGRIVYHRMLGIADRIRVIGGIRALDLRDALLSTAVLTPGPVAFALVSAGARAQLGLLHREPSRLTARWERLRSGLDARLRTLEAGHRHRADAAWILKNADPACESPGEAHVLWALRASGIAGTDPQHEVRTNGGRFFIDIALPGLRLAIEFDGLVKYGAGAAEVLQSRRAEAARQRLLEEAGWIVVRLRWADLGDSARLLAAIDEVAAGRGIDLERMRPARLRPAA